MVAIDDETARSNDAAENGLHTEGAYSKLSANISRNQTLYKNLSLFGSVNGQWTNSNLDSAEQFSLGGPSGVRAFPVGEASGDMGVICTGELRYLFESLRIFPGSLQLSAFFDYGTVTLHKNPVAPDNNRHIAGAGFGLSWFDAESFNIRTTVAWKTDGTASGQSEISQPTVYLQAVKRF